MKLDPNALYLGDNGRCFCGAHAGATAQASGRDLSGQPVYRLTPDDLRYAQTNLDFTPTCETCHPKGIAK